MVIFTICIGALVKMIEIAKLDDNNTNSNVIKGLMDWKKRQGLDTYGFLGLFAFISRQLLDEFNCQTNSNTNNRNNTEPLFGIKSIMPASVCCYLLYSRSQTELLQIFLVDLISTYIATGVVSGVSNEEGGGAAAKKPIITQNDDDGDASTLLGIDKGFRPNQYLDVLRLASAARVALWCHDLTPLLQHIEKGSLKRFAVTKDSLDVFLELVLVRKYATLLNFAKIDKTSRGRQLLALLTLVDIDTNTNTVNTTPTVRNQLRKNAFSLVRLRKYKEAAATFLLAEPPMLREASSILCGQLDDPYYALLVIRLVEARIGPKARPGGLLLGPISRNIINNFIIPSSSSSLISSSESLCLSKLEFKSTDSLALVFLSLLWYQDMQTFKQLSDLKNIFSFIKPNYCNNYRQYHNDSAKVYFDSNILSATSLVTWLITQFGKSFFSGNTNTNTNNNVDNDNNDNNDNTHTNNNTNTN